MKKLFALLLVILSIWTSITLLTLPDALSDKPVIYWVSGNNPARKTQINAFNQWMEKSGNPPVEMRLDVTNGQKKVIQAVSGIAGDVIDAYGDSNYQYQDLGIVSDITEKAQEFGFTADLTFSAARPIIEIEGRQYGFPCNVGNNFLIINKDVFRKYGMEPPPREMDIETFERIGKEFVAKANEGKEVNDVFFLESSLSSQSRVVKQLMRTTGLSFFNETMTRSVVNDPRLVEVFRRFYQWMYVDNLIPTAAEAGSFSAESSGFGGATLQLFAKGHYGMIYTGRWVLIGARQLAEPVDLGAAYIPYYQFPITDITYRIGTIYAGADNPDLAVYFLKYLATEDYAGLFVDDPDGFPPNPIYAGTEEQLRPQAYKNEWDVHQTSYESLNSIALADSVSPFVTPGAVGRHMRDYLEGVLAKIYTPEEAVAKLEARINDEIERSVNENLGLKEKHEKRLKQQAEIDRLKEAGELIPAEMVLDPLLRKDYQMKGLLAE